MPSLQNHITTIIPITALSLLVVVLFFPPALSHTHPNIPSCRSYCGNLTIDYPFTLKQGCGHPGYRNLLYCINNVLMLHIPSGSYRVLDIDYAYQALTLHDAHLSTCDNIFLGTKGNGFVLEPWRSPYLNPTPDNVFFLIGCSPQSPLFQGFPTKHVPCRNVSGMGCEDYYKCPGWKNEDKKVDIGNGVAPECCAVSFEEIKGINLSKLECQGYSSAYSLAPLKVDDGARGWSYGIRVKYSADVNDEFCNACDATGGSCGFGGDGDGVQELCLCGTWNSTSTCDHSDETSAGNGGASWSLMDMLIGGFATTMIIAWTSIYPS